MKKISISLFAIILASASFAQINPLTIGSIEAGDSIVIYYNVKINKPFPASRIATKGNVSGGNFSTVTTDDPGTGTAGDSTYTDVVNNFRPQFTGGSGGPFIVCPNSTSNSVNSILTATDTDNGQTLTWSILTGPLNGSVSGFPYNTSTTGSPITPSGLSYTPTASYIGTDSFFVRVSDGNEHDTFVVRVKMTEINVKGNSVSITDGDASAVTADHTDFGNQSICSGTVVRTFTIENTGSGVLTVSAVNITGAALADYTVTASPSGTVLGSGSTTFQVTFNPSAPGARDATITISNSDCDEADYDFAISGTGTDPEISVEGNSNSIADEDITPDPGDHTDFGSQSICSGTVVRTFTVKNTGNIDLSLGTVTVGGTNSADFSVNVTPSSPVAASGSTTFQVTFDPSAAGLRSADITFTSNDCDEATYNFNIQGTGTDPEANVQGNSVSIADEDITPDPGDHTDFGSQDICSGTIVRTFTIQNTGNVDLTLGTVTIGGTNSADFSVSATPSSPVAASGSTTFQVTFDPSAVGLRSADITFTNNDCNEATYNFNIQGTGTDPEINITGNSTGIIDGDATPSLADHSDFGSMSICSGTIVRTFTIENTGSGTLTVASVNISGTASADYSVSASPSGTVSASGNTTFQVTFNPSASGARDAIVTVNSSDCNEAAYDFAITGMGIDPEISVEGNGVVIADEDATPALSDHSDFGSQLYTSGSLSRTFTIKNTGSANLLLSGAPKVAVSGTHASDFTVTVQPSSPVSGPNGTSTFTVVFDPSALGLRSATLSIDNNDCNENPHNFSISGTGVLSSLNVKGNADGVSIADADATPSLADSTDVGEKIINTSLVARYTIHNIGTGNISISGTSLTGIDAGQFAISSVTSSTITPGGSATFTVTFTPTSSGSKTATVHIASNDIGFPDYDFDILGNGITTYTYNGNSPDDWLDQHNWSPSHPGTTIPEGYTVYIPSGSNLIVPSGTTIVNNGTLNNDGTFTMSGSGKFNNKGTYKGSGIFLGAPFVNPPNGIISPGD